jgi:two-component system response regulator TctD
MQILLVEDDATISRELSMRWQRRGWQVHAAPTLADAQARYDQGTTDLIVLDMGLPDGDGQTWLVRLRERDRNTPVLVLTARDRVVDRVQGLQSGADDYMVKPFAIDELDARIEVLMRRAERSTGKAASYGNLVWLESEGRVTIGGRPLELSPREFEVLGLLIRRAPRLVSKRALVDALAERNLDVGDSAAEVYVSRLRRKLAGSGVEIRTLRGFGYLLAPEGGDAPADSDMS